jgi:hypothetical protein
MSSDPEMPEANHIFRTREIERALVSSAKNSVYEGSTESFQRMNDPRWAKIVGIRQKRETVLPEPALKLSGLEQDALVWHDAITPKSAEHVLKHEDILPHLVDEFLSHLDIRIPNRIKSGPSRYINESPGFWHNHW